MNDTIVVFDRIRENASKMRDKKFPMIVNLSVNETLSRTILTSATVFFVTLAMNIWGTGVIRDFAFAMNVGVIVGTYSSIFIAEPDPDLAQRKVDAVAEKPAVRALFRPSNRARAAVRRTMSPVRCPAPNFSSGQFIDFRGHRIFVRDAGHGPSFCLHGFPTSSYDFARIVPGLSRTGG